MYIQDCWHPKKVWNKYLNQWVNVSCGKCPACLQSRANKWIERLNVERKCWKYCVFFTLTYDPEYRPYLSLYDNILTDLSHKHQAPSVDPPVINFSDLLSSCDNKESQRIIDLMSCYDNKIPYLSVYDIQLFVKRLRKNLQNCIKKNYKDYDEKDYKVRYYIAGEYGPTTFLPHYHGLLFFSSEKEASCIQDCIYKSWKLGITDSEFIPNCNANYVAKYINCTADLPKVLVSPKIRSFAVFSKCPPIGTLYFRDESIEEIFHSASPTVFVDYFNRQTVSSVPLWRTFKDRLFPKISGYSRFSFVDRVKLYRSVGYLESLSCFEWSSSDFVQHMFICYNAVELGKRSKNLYFSDTYLTLYHDYIKYLFGNVNVLDHQRESLMRWFRISHRVCCQASAFNVTVEDYVRKIELFYENVDKDLLKLHFNFQSEFIEKYHDVSKLIGIDSLYLESLADCDPALLSQEDLLILDSYGVDLEKFTSPDLVVRQQYYDELLPKHTRSYEAMILESSHWLKKATKTKIKNDTLRLRPEFQKLHH